MKGQIRASILGFGAAMMVVACASKGPANPTGMAHAGADPQDPLAAEYDSLIDNARNAVVCRSEAVTGSRIHKREICLTAAEAEAERERAVALVRSMRDRSATMPQPMPGRTMSVPAPMPSRP